MLVLTLAGALGFGCLSDEATPPGGADPAISKWRDRCASEDLDSTSLTQTPAPIPPSTRTGGGGLPFVICPGVWFDEYNAARAMSRQKGLPLLLFFGDDECSWCEQLERKSLANCTVSRLLKERFILLRVNDQEEQLARALHIDAYPTLVLAAPDGRIMQTVVGFHEGAKLHGILLRALAAVEKTSRLAEIREAPEFSLVAQDGAPLQLSKLKGKVLLVSFIFTTCSGSCPATTHRMAAVQDELKRRGLLKNGQVRLLSISLDPARDTPEVLRNYMRLYDADPATWTFLTGPPERVSKTIAAWGMWARPAANAQLDHPSRIFLVDRRGMIREIYNLDFLRAPWVADDIELLLNEPTR